MNVSINVIIMIHPAHTDKTKPYTINECNSIQSICYGIDVTPSQDHQILCVQMVQTDLAVSRVLVVK